MKLFATIEGDIRALMKAELAVAERAVTAGVSEAATGLQTAWRGQITGATLGQKLANSVRKKLYPTTGASIRAAAVVYSNASKVVDAFDRGVIIRSKNGFWLAIPTAAAGKKGVGNQRITDNTGKCRNEKSVGLPGIGRGAVDFGAMHVVVGQPRRKFRFECLE